MRFGFGLDRLPPAGRVLCANRRIVKALTKL
jgi:hypothetical protein